MKVIITGATGFIGQGVLSRLVAQPSITSIILFSRRPLKLEVYFSSSKVKVVEVDFENYSDKVKDEIRDAEASFWCMGSNNPEKPVNLDYPCYFVIVMGEIVRERQGFEGRVFRCVHVGGALTLRDQQASAWFLGDTRRLRGLAESKVLDVASEDWAKGKWETIVVKPGGVMGTWPIRDMFLGKLTGSDIFVHRNELAATMVDVAINGYNDGTDSIGKSIFNRDIIAKGRKILGQK